MLFFTAFKRKKCRQRPFPDRWKEIIERNVPVWHRLGAGDRKELQEHMHVFLAEKVFEGAAGFTVTEEMKVTIASQASLLLLHRNVDYFPRVTSIVLYPDEYAAPHWQMDEAGIVTEGVDWRSGEAWGGGSLVLSWKDVIWGTTRPEDGYNVVLHEFAHELDMEDGFTDGTPPLGDRKDYEEWRSVLQQEFDAMRKKLELQQPTFLDPYAGDHPAEFFAVAVEAFFELPRAMKEHHPALYEVLQKYFLQDPATWEFSS